MTATRKQFTKRLGVRLATVCGIVVLGAIALAQAQFLGSRTGGTAEEVSEPVADSPPANEPGIRPIPRPDEGEPDGSDWGQASTSRWDELPEPPRSAAEAEGPAGTEFSGPAEPPDARDTPAPWDLALAGPPRFDEADPGPEAGRPRIREVHNADDSSVYAGPPREPPEPEARPASWSDEPPRRSATASWAMEESGNDESAEPSYYVRAQSDVEEDDDDLDRGPAGPPAALSAPADARSVSQDASPDGDFSPPATAEDPVPDGASLEPPPFQFDSVSDASPAELARSMPEPPAEREPEAIAEREPEAIAEAEPEAIAEPDRASGGRSQDAHGVAGSARGEAGFEGDGAPGAETLDGRQAPALVVKKVAPPEIQVGKEASFELHIQNVGQVAAHDLIVLDRVPRGTRFVSAQPSKRLTSEGQLMWQLGTLQPGDETTVVLRVLPIAEGEIGSVAQVLFQTHASARTVCTRPVLEVQHKGPERVLIGEPVVLDIQLANTGTGAATGVVLVEDVPQGLTHAAGRELEYEVGTLQPGESRRLQLTLEAEEPGQIENRLVVRGDGNLIARDSITLEVIAPDLEVALSGPRKRYLQREATYEVAVNNPGTATAREVELVTYLPKGMKFLSADRRGQYEPQNHAVYWSLVELPPQETGVAKLTLLPLESGEQRLSLEGRAALGVKHSTEKRVQVDTIAELRFSVTDEADPIEIGTETTYVITLSNSGSSAATDIQLSVNMPSGLEPVSGEGPTKITVEGSRVQVEPLAHLAPGEQAIYRLRARGLEAGPQRFQVQLLTAETPVPVTKEEVTRVYADR